MRIGALEAGGTKMVCAICTENGEILLREEFPTISPEVTMPLIIDYYLKEKIEALGIGCFGPINPNKGTQGYGFITSTPKLKWQNYDIVGAFRKALHCPVGFDTDVNVAALGEATFGITRGMPNSVYITVGTGIGMGILANGVLYHGNMHPEAGHMPVKRHDKDSYEGCCPFHQDCLEGLASGPAIQKRWCKPGFELTDREEVWELEAYYLAQACMSCTLFYAPQRIVLGGGVMKQPSLLIKVREEFAALMAGYIKTKEVKHINDYIVSASLNDNQAILGCIKLALLA